MWTFWPSWRASAAATWVVAVLAVGAMPAIVGASPATSQTSRHRVHGRATAAPLVQDEVFAVNGGQGSVSSFSLGAGGALTQNTTPAADYSGEDVAITPDHQYLYTSNTYAGTITEFLVGSYGDLTQIGQPVPATPISKIGTSAGPNGLAVAPDGDYLFVVDTYASEVSSFKIGSAGELSYIGAYATGDIAGTGTPSSIVVAPDGDFLYVDEISDQYFTSFSIDAGVLDNLGNSDGWPNCGGKSTVGGASVAAAMTPDGKTIYLASGSCIYWFKVNGADLTIEDELHPVITGTSQTATDVAGGLSITPDGDYLYSANYLQNTISAYSLAPSGEPTSLGPPIAAGTGPWQTTVSPDDQYLYVTNYSSGTISTYSIADGTPVPVGSPIATGSGAAPFPAGIVVAQTCEHESDLTDGDWQVEGCFDQTDSSDWDTTSPTNVDGLGIIPTAASDLIDYTTGGSSGDSIVTTQPSELAADTFTISKGTTGLIPITTTLPTKVSLGGTPIATKTAANTNFLGLPISGPISFKPLANGIATATVAGQLPGVLGGGDASITFTSQINKGVTSVVATAAAGSLANLYRLDTISLTYSNGTWSVDATATGAGGNAEKLTGSITFGSTNQVTAASLEVSNVVVAGLLNVKTFKVFFADGKWGGSADLAQGGQAASVAFTFSPQGVMLTGSLTASGVALFQVFELKSFAMSYAQKTDSWSLAISVAGEPGAPAVDATLKVQANEVTGASLTFQRVSFLGKITIDKLALTYSLDAGNTAIFRGAVSLAIPGTVINGVDANFEFTNGLFTAGGLTLHGNVPLYGGIYLTTLGADIRLSPIEEFTGHVGLSAGPKTSEGPILGLEDGTIDYQFASALHPNGAYSFSGAMYALKLELGSASMTADESGITLTVNLGTDGAGFKIGDLVSLVGTVKGTLSASALALQGDVNFTLKIAGHSFAASGTGYISDVGLIACANIPAVSKKGPSGIAYKWGGGTPSLMAGDCAAGKF